MVLAMIIVTVVLLRLMQSLSEAQSAGNMLALGVPSFVPLKNGKEGSSEHRPEDGAS